MGYHTLSFIPNDVLSAYLDGPKREAALQQIKEMTGSAEVHYHRGVVGGKDPKDYLSYVHLVDSQVSIIGLQDLNLNNIFSSGDSVWEGLPE